MDDVILLPGHRSQHDVLVVAGHFCGVFIVLLRVGDSSLMLLFGRSFLDSFRQSEMEVEREKGISEC